jgi:hypothetical protein
MNRVWAARMAASVSAGLIVVDADTGGVAVVVAAVDADDPGGPVDPVDPLDDGAEAPLEQPAPTTVANSNEATANTTQRAAGRWQVTSSRL